MPFELPLVMYSVVPTLHFSLARLGAIDTGFLSGGIR